MGCVLLKAQPLQGQEENAPPPRRALLPLLRVDAHTPGLCECPRSPAVCSLPSHCRGASFGEAAGSGVQWVQSGSHGGVGAVQMCALWEHGQGGWVVQAW